MKRVRRFTAICLMLLIAGGAYLGVQYLTGNIHEVIAGEFYRSGQLSGTKLAGAIERYQIKTVLNLRGDSQRKWYQDEVATTKRLGVQHINFQMSARRTLTAEQTQQLLEIMRTAPKPLLIHCEGGADRTGLASVLYMQQIAGVNEDVAELQLSPLFGHLNIPWLSGFDAMHETWKNYETANNIEAGGLL